MLVEGQYNLQSLSAAILKKRVIVTDGPFAEIKLISDHQTALIGDEFEGNAGELHINALSTPVFGEIKDIVVCLGDIDTGKETPLPVEFKGDHNVSVRRHISPLPEKGYLRLNVTSKTAENEFHCFTNPIYLGPGRITSA